MEEKTIQSIPVMPFALMMACITAVILFIVGIIYAVIGFAVLSAISGLPTTSGINTTGFGILFGAAAIIIFPILGFIAGLIQGVIYAWVYNFLAPRIGGIKLRFKEEYRAPPQQ